MQRRDLLKIGAGAFACSALRPAIAAASRFRMVLLGDCLLTHGIVRDNPKFAKLLPILRNTDVTIANFEGTLADAGTWGTSVGMNQSSVCGGMNVRGDDKVADDMAWIGVKMAGTANNHAWDWGPDGVLATTAKLTKAGIQHTGTGKDLDDARKPAYYGPEGTRTALISCASTFWPGTSASHATENLPGRPGVSPLRVQKGVINAMDRDEILGSVRAARAQAAYVVVSCHIHESDGPSENPPAFGKEIARACIDAGADVFFSHGPHVLRGIELYKGKPIFHGLGAFFWCAWDTKPLPSDLFEACGQASHDSGEYFLNRVKEWLDVVEFWQGMVPQLEFDRGRLAALTITPTVLQRGEQPVFGMPAQAEGDEARAILARMQKLSEPFGTKLQISGGVGRVQL